MKKIVAHIYYTTKVLFSLFRFRLAIARIHKQETVLVVDIDNTLADTWVTLLQNGYENAEDRNLRLPIFINMRNWVLSYQLKQVRVFFLTARNASLYKCTLEWLNGNQIPVKPNQLYLVPKPQYKMLFLSHLLAKTNDVMYIDDLTYGHEFGEVQIHQKLIDEVKQKKIIYFGVDQIAAINNNTYVG